MLNLLHVLHRIHGEQAETARWAAKLYEPRNPTSHCRLVVLHDEELRFVLLSQHGLNVHRMLLDYDCRARIPYLVV